MEGIVSCGGVSEYPNGSRGVVLDPGLTIKGKVLDGAGEEGCCLATSTRTILFAFARALNVKHACIIGATPQRQGNFDDGP